MILGRQERKERKERQEVLVHRELLACRVRQEPLVQPDHRAPPEWLDHRAHRGRRAILDHKVYKVIQECRDPRARKARRDPKEQRRSDHK